MKKYLIFIFLLFPNLLIQAQDETWYIWIDTIVHIDGVETRLVSREPLIITCCLQSSKYTRLQKAAVKWIKKNYNSDYNFRSAFVLIQDKSLAMEVINDARAKSESGEAVLMIEYDAVCD